MFLMVILPFFSYIRVGSLSLFLTSKKNHKSFLTSLVLFLSYTWVTMVEAFRKLGEKVGVSLNWNAPLPKESSKNPLRQGGVPSGGKGSSKPKAVTKKQRGRCSLR